MVSAFNINLLFLSSRVSRRWIYLFILLLDLCLHLLQLLLAFIGTHPQALPQHADAKDGKESGGHIVCVDSGDDGGGIAKQHWGEVTHSNEFISTLHELKDQPTHPHLRTRQTGHESQGQHGSRQHGEAVVTHGHDGGDEKCLVPQFGHDDDGDGCHEGMDEPQVSFGGCIFSSNWTKCTLARNFLRRKSTVGKVTGESGTFLQTGWKVPDYGGRLSFFCVLPFQEACAKTRTCGNQPPP